MRERVQRENQIIYYNEYFKNQGLMNNQQEKNILIKDEELGDLLYKVHNSTKELKKNYVEDS